MSIRFRFFIILATKALSKYVAGVPDVPNVILEPTGETVANAKVNREIFSVAILSDDVLDHVLSNHPLPRVSQITVSLWQFICSCREQPRRRKSVSIITEQMQHQELWWMK